MKHWLFLIAIVSSTFAQAGQGPFLLGGILGDPTGVSGKYEMDKASAVDGALSWSGGTRTGVQIHSDYLRYRNDAIVAGDTEIDLYYGIGARLVTISSGKDSGKVSFGPRVPIGLKHELQDPSVEFFGELALVLDLIPSTVADVDIGAGIRYRF